MNEVNQERLVVFQHRPANERPEFAVLRMHELSIHSAILKRRYTYAVYDRQERFADMISIALKSTGKR